uniref:RNase H type-1 domain-containing protein n=1 Tax=Brassica oleracea TaxID=3712 RepID=A0A3P6DQY2_BRAOL|nr:unnamed protein product [Brassica oleracea]
MAEAIAIRSAVMYAASSNVKSLMIRSDSCMLPLQISSFDVISFVYVPRLRNV